MTVKTPGSAVGIGVRVRRQLPVALVVAALAAGCGSDEPPTPAEWADGVCSAISTWKDSLASAAEPIKSGDISEDSLQTAADDVESATDTLESDLNDLEKPNLEAGQQAQDQIDQLASDLQTDVDTIQSAVNDVSDVSGVAAAATTVTTTLATMQTQASSTVTSLQQVDATGELKTAFEQADSCQQLTS
jgi:uncharacterized protein YoxC